ncbi:MAG: anaerobic ribonucleoside-triphosphate reductase activating protein [Raoultibacter sp.]
MSEEPEVIRLFGTATDSIVDGPGLRYAVFVQGCTHCCPGCHNPESQPAAGGTVELVDDIVERIEENRLIQGVTLSGGEPFEQCGACLALAKKLKERGYALWIYSGYTYEDLCAGKPDPLAPELLTCCDVLVDGPFVKALNSYDLTWRGSSNQRVIDLAASREQNDIVLWQTRDSFPEVPASW